MVQDLMIRTGNSAVIQQALSQAPNDPMMQSGLAFAGSQTWELSPEEDTDSSCIILSNEIQLLQLRGTELVCLSACETGLGEASSGMGVMAMSRAFLLAGARTLVLTFWKIPDGATISLMTQFYSGMLIGRAGKAKALRDAQRLLRKDFPREPSRWASFFVHGDPGPLRL